MRQQLTAANHQRGISVIGYTSGFFAANKKMRQNSCLRRRSLTHCRRMKSQSCSKVFIGPWGPIKLNLLRPFDHSDRGGDKKLNAFGSNGLRSVKRSLRNGRKENVILGENSQKWHCTYKSPPTTDHIDWMGIFAIDSNKNKADEGVWTWNGHPDEIGAIWANRKVTRCGRNSHTT